MKRTLFVHSDKEIKDILERVIGDGFDFDKDEDKYCYLVEEKEIDKRKVIELYNELYERGIKFYISVETRENAERDEYESDYDEDRVIHEFIPKEYINADTGVKKLCAYIFHSKKENISMKG